MDDRVALGVEMPGFVMAVNACALCAGTWGEGCDVDGAAEEEGGDCLGSFHCSAN